MKIIGYDIAKSGSDSTAMQFRLPQYDAVDPPELPKVGEEYCFTPWERKRYGMSPEEKLIVASVYERDDIPYMTVIVR